MNNQKELFEKIQDYIKAVQFVYLVVRCNKLMLSTPPEICDAAQHYLIKRA